jgi:hypothetical protein
VPKEGAVGEVLVVEGEADHPFRYLVQGPLSDLPKTVLASFSTLSKNSSSIPLLKIQQT